MNKLLFFIVGVFLIFSSTIFFVKETQRAMVFQLGEIKRDDYLVWDVSISYQMSNNHNISLIINNLSNQSYYANADDKASLQPERNLRLTSQWTF